MKKDISGDRFAIQFWGVRGSIPSPGPTTLRYGGNTSCIEMRIGGKRLIFDGGTGLRLLGKSLSPSLEEEIYMFFTHYHWDHIQGLPFFFPSFDEESRFIIHGQVPDEGEPMKMARHFRDRVLHLNSPIPIAQIRAQMKFHDLVCGELFTLDDIAIETAPLNHPNGAMGYRISWGGHTAVYCTDTEQFPDRLDENVLHLARDADILIYDAMYTDEEYHNPKTPKVGWGHSTWQEGVRVCQAAGVKRLVVFHHDPNHSDDFLDNVAIEVEAALPGSVLAKEGMILHLDRLNDE
ncbi:MBL fold metallo-hydrolase [Oscillatoria sp. FACHB-1406]|uniref:MBL fold metallo-hydrolase n=1 Tax=Oscillatoria sp. FACHB-1406 TaxID=2692846 RepID=UPI001688E4A5|nr:MBL fold metallo-hydrolase [Oscillatoria sp. FACHB-1406]MBD2576218.1 MBL fold metallo-hydrolase [Oscillatoria sp. FACHB-1406]